MSLLPLIESSPKALAQCPDDYKKRNLIESKTEASKARESKYPFPEMQIGQSFVIAFADSDLQTYSNLKNVASLARKRFPGRKFKVLTHTEEKLFEVARVL